MTMTPCVAPSRVLDHEETEKGSPERILVPLQSPEARFLSTHTPHDDTSSRSSHLRASQASPASLDASPVLTLLEELLVEIFDDVITTESSYLCRDTHAGQWLCPPRNLARVSRTWKTIVFTCPKLWRYVHVTPAQSIRALEEQLRLSSPFPIHLRVHQWPFRNPTSASGPSSIVALTAQLQSILALSDEEVAPASQRVESVAINATEYGTFPNFVLQTWTGPGSRFPALRRVTVNGNVCATWSRACFFDERNAPGLERLELSNIVLASDASRLPWGTGLNLTTLVWSAPMHQRGSLTVSVACFRHIVSSFPSLVTVELHEHVIGLEFANLESLEESGITPLPHVRELRVSGCVFPNAQAAYVLFLLLPSVRRLAVRGRACSGPLAMRTVTLALRGLIFFPVGLGWPMVLANVDELELECLEGQCDKWSTWTMEELERWRKWRESVVNMRNVDSALRVRVHMTKFL